MAFIDVTAIATAFEPDFVAAATELLFAYITTVPGLQWVRLPIISSLVKAALKALLTYLANDALMEAFFRQTALVKAGQATDYIKAVEAIKNLPANATTAEFKNAEQAKMAAFRNLVLFTNVPT